MYEYRVFDTVFDMTVFYGDKDACEQRLWYEWKFGPHDHQEGRFVLQRRPINPRWEDVN
jgi:hypothetical protein